MGFGNTKPMDRSLKLVKAITENKDAIIIGRCANIIYKDSIYYLLYDWLTRKRLDYPIRSNSIRFFLSFHLSFLTLIYKRNGRRESVPNFHPPHLSSEVWIINDSRKFFLLILFSTDFSTLFPIRFPINLSPFEHLDYTRY